MKNKNDLIIEKRSHKKRLRILLMILGLVTIISGIYCLVTNTLPIFPVITMIIEVFVSRKFSKLD